jgi:DNA polymerase-1
MVPNTLVLDEEEQRKQLTTTFQAGGDFFLFDESPYVGGKHLARALTAPVWTDRILGTNNTVEVPNQATMIVLGNNVRVEGDLQRRVYPINLRPKSPNPHLRRNDEFKHPDFLAYTRKNRRKILVALLTLVRAWFAAGQPKPKKPVTFGSFEVFEKTLGGILENAGIHGFLDNRTSFAQESSFEMRHWEDHLHWLHGTFGDDKFTTKQVQKAILEDPQNAETPPGMEDASGKSYTRQLGVEYSKIYERFIGGYRLVKDGQTRTRVGLWRVESIDGYTPPTDDKPKGDDGNGGGGNSPAPTAPVSDGGYALPLQPEYAGTNVENLSVFDVLGAMSSNKDVESVSSNEDDQDVSSNEDVESVSSNEDPFATPADDDEEIKQEVAEYNSLVWDIESGDSNDLFRWEKGKYLTISGYQGDDGENVVTESGDEVVEAVTKSKRHYGFNLLGFDIPALAVHHNGDYLEMSKNAVDLMLIERQINPTDAKGVPPKYYGLDKTAKRYGHQGKTDDLNKLKVKYGSYHNIPKNELVPYLHGDLDATRFLADEIGHHYDEDPYIQREHEVMRRVNYGPRLQGFRLDLDELQSRLHEGEQRKAANIMRLHEEYGMPLGRWKKFARKDDEWEVFRNPLASGPGKEWLEEIFKELGATAMRRTDKSKEISTNKDDLKAAIDFYMGSDDSVLRRKGINPDTLQRDKIKDLCELIMAVTGERTVYQTIETYRVGDRVHPIVSPDQASGRWSVKQPGLTVLGKRGGKHVERGVLLADPGEVLIAVDLDQVDARAIAAHCGDPEYMKLFEPGMDLHSTNAERAFGRSDGEWRDRAKILGHGFNYGLGPKGAAAQTGMDLEIAMRFHAMMKETYPRLEEWKNEIRALAENGYLLDNGFGRKMKCNPERAYTQAPALVGQGATRDIIAQGILNLDMDLVRRMKVIVHDEIVFSLPEATWESDVERILRAMQFPIQFNGNPPMRITAGVSKPGRSWADVYAK